MNVEERETLRALAERLEAVDHPEARAAAQKLRRLASPRRRGRAPARAEVRVLRRLQRAMVAADIYDGRLPARHIPCGRELEVERAAGSWIEAQALAGELVGGVSGRTIEADRLALTDDSGRLRLRLRLDSDSPGEREEAFALLRLLGVEVESVPPSRSNSSN